MSEQLLQERLASLTPEYSEFVEGEFVSEAAAAFGGDLQFSERQVDILENALMLYFLFFLDETEVVTFIASNCDISPAEAADLLASIQSVLPTPASLIIKKGYETFNQPSTTSSNELSREIAETEKTYEQLRGIRTMAKDMHAIGHDEPVYTSSQETLLQKDHSSTETPRWESER